MAETHSPDAHTSDQGRTAAGDSYDSLKAAPVQRVRAAIRKRRFNGQTAGLAPGRLQANIAILPASHALDFMRYCQRNPKPCPLVAVTDTGDPMMRTAGDVDIRTDVPSYNIYRDGALAGTVDGITDLWRDDFVAFALGCSFTFERALQEAGIAMPHIAANATVAMYRSSIETRKAGPFGGGTVVSMRLIAPDRVDDAIRISAAYPWAHGAPVHVGDPQAIGIADLAAPDWGDPPIAPAGIDDAVPVFWACGVTPQNALRLARPPICITHTPGRMLITDVDERADQPFVGVPAQSNPTKGD